MKTELFREMTCRFVQNELGYPTFLSHLFAENTTLYDISKFEEFFIIQFSNIPFYSLLQSDLRCITERVETLDLPIILLLSFLRKL